MGIKYNLISGVFAALAGVFSKTPVSQRFMPVAKVGFNFGDDGTIS
jgi:hypothetical protein